MTGAVALRRPQPPARKCRSTTRAAQQRLLRARDRALELGLAHLRAALDVEPARLGLELLARRLVAATDGGRLLAQRGARLRREVLQSLLLLRAGLRLLDVLARGLALLRGRHADRATRLRFVWHGRTLRMHGGAAASARARQSKPPP